MKRIAIIALLCLGAAKSSQLMVKSKVMTMALPVVVPLSKTVFFAVTAYDNNGIESDYSIELAASVTNNTIILAWDSTNSTGYRLYWGTNSHSYIWSKDVGTVKTYMIPSVIPVPPPIPLYFAVYGQSSTNVVGPFLDISSTPIARFTNGVGLPRNFYRLREFSSTNAIP